MKNKKLMVIFLIVFVDLLGFGILIPILPIYATRQFHANEFEIGMMISVFSFCQFIANPILGKISDKIGRKVILTTSLFSTSISYIVFAFAPNYTVAFLARAMAGIGGGSLSTAQAYISDVTDESERAKGMGLMGAAFGLGFVFGPIIGGAFSHINYIAPNLAAAGFSFLAMILAILILHETVHKTDEKLNVRGIFNYNNYKTAFIQKRLGTLILTFFLLTFSVANTYGLLPLLGINRLNLKDSEISYLYGIIGSISIFIQAYFLKILLQKFKEEKLLSYGLIFSALGLALIPFTENFLTAVVILTIMALGTAIATPLLLSMISKSADPNQQGAILGVNQSMGSLGRVLGPLWGGWTYLHFGYQIPFYTAGLFTLLALTIKTINLKSIKSQ